MKNIIIIILGIIALQNFANTLLLNMNQQEILKSIDKESLCSITAQKM